MRIAFLGLGVMGAPMAGHLIAGGHDLTGYDPDPAAGAGLPRAGSAAEAVAGAEIVFAMLPHGRAVQAAVAEFETALTPGALVADTSSSEPWLTRETAARLAARGAAMVDAPVSGAEWGAKAADLVFIVGGDPADVDRLRPLLALMGRETHHVGPLGAGHVMKTLNNVVTAMSVIATTEAMLIGRAAGLDPKAMTDVLNVSTGQSFWTTHRVAQDVLNGAFADGFKLELMRKDVEIANRLGRDLGLEAPLLAMGEAMWREADAALGPNRAVTEMARWIEGRMGHELRAAETDDA